MTEDLIKRLMLAGLTKQQATSTTANTLVRLFMPEDGKMLLQEAKQQVDDLLWRSYRANILTFRGSSTASPLPYSPSAKLRNSTGL